MDVIDEKKLYPPRGDAPSPTLSDATTPEDAGDLKTRLSYHLANTGMHGLPNVSHSKSAFRKTFWILLTLVGLGVMTWQIYVAFAKFFTYPAKTTVDFNLTTPLQFPAVTICNLNPIRLNAMETSDFANDMEAIIDQQWDDWAKEETGSGVEKPSAFNDFGEEYYEDYGEEPTEDYNGDEGDYGGELRRKRRKRAVVEEEEKEDDDFNFQTNILSMARKLSRQERMQLGHNITSMLIGCTFNGKECTPKDFTSFSSYLYGNCFTFNSGHNNKTLKEVYKIGPLYGLTLELFVQQDEYVKGMADSAGFRVLIHNQTDMAFPEDDGFNIAPGLKSSIGMKKTIVKRAKPNYGQCKDHTQQENWKNNAFISELDHINYSSSACRKTCYQRAVLKQCNCYDPNFPYNRNTKSQIYAYRDITNETTYDPCNDESGIYVKCMTEVSANYSSGALGCADQCPPPCYETFYLGESSFSSWPSTAVKDRLVDTMALHSEYFWNQLEAFHWDDAKILPYLKDNVAKLEVYYNDMSVQTIATDPAYEIINLVSDFGGQAGLWVGVSMIAIAELFELCFDMTLICCKSCCSKCKKSGRGGGSSKKARAMVVEPITDNGSVPPKATALP